MSDPHPVLSIVGLAEPNADGPFDDQPSAATEPTASPIDGEESISLDDAMDALEHPDAPPSEAAPVGDSPPDTPALALTPEQIAAIVAENDQFKAEKAAFEAEQEVAAYDDRWDAFIARGDDYYRVLAQSVGRYFEAKGESPAEVEGRIKRIVYDGQDIHTIPQHILPPGFLPPKPGEPGWVAWRNDTLTNRLHETRQYLTQKTQPSLVDQIAAQYALDETDRTTLAKFVKYPPEAIEEIARGFAAKNQRLTSHQSTVVQQARANVAANLSNGIAPGTPGMTAPKKDYQYTGKPELKRRETEYFVRRLGLPISS